MARQEQLFEVFRILSSGVFARPKDLEKLDKDHLQEQVIKQPVRAVSEFFRFLENGARVVVVIANLVLKPALAFDPAKFIGENWSVWKGPLDGNGLEGQSARDVREDRLSEIDWSQVKFSAPDSVIKGEEFLCRQKEGGDIRLGGRAFLSLWENYQANRENSVLEHLRRTRGITRMYFFGLPLRSPLGFRNVLYLYFFGREWYWCYDWLENDWDADSPSALLASISP